MNPVTENTAISIPDERLDLLGEKEGKAYFFASGNAARFAGRVVMDTINNTEWTNLIIHFKRTVNIRQAQKIVKKIQRTFKELDRKVEIDAIYEVPTDMYDALVREHNMTDHERALIVQTFVDILNKLRSTLGKETDIAEYLADKLQSWERKDIEAACTLTSNYHEYERCEIPMMQLLDATAYLKLYIKEKRIV